MGAARGRAVSVRPRPPEGTRGVRTGRTKGGGSPEPPAAQLGAAAWGRRGPARGRGLRPQTRSLLGGGGGKKRGVGVTHPPVGPPGSSAAPRSPLPPLRNFSRRLTSRSPQPMGAAGAILGGGVCVCARGPPLAAGARPAAVRARCRGAGGREAGSERRPLRPPAAPRRLPVPAPPARGCGGAAAAAASAAGSAPGAFTCCARLSPACCPARTCCPRRCGAGEAARHAAAAEGWSAGGHRRFPFIRGRVWLQPG